MNYTFRKIGIVATVCTMALFAASCEKSEFQEEGLGHVPGVVRTISADAGLPATTNSDKAFLDLNDMNKVKWEASDVLNFNGTNISVSSIYSNGETARFTGEARALQNSDQTKDIYWAVYPAVLAENASGYVPANFSTTGLTVNFPASQSYDPTNDATLINQYSFMAAYSEVDAGSSHIDMQMRNLGAVLHLELSPAAGQANTHVSRIEFTTTDGALAGNFTIGTDATTVTAASSAAKILTVYLSTSNVKYVDIAGGADVYVVLPPMNNKQLTMKIYNDEGRLMQKDASGVEFERNKIYTATINDVNFDKTDPYFSVSDANKVLFALGNLQWSAKNGGSTATTHKVADGTTKAGTWRFSEHQWDVLLNGNNNISSTYSGWIDLFGWGTSGYNGQNPYKTNTNDNDYLAHNLIGSYKNYDWGIYNEIYNPQTQATDAPGTWRTLTVSEWDYVLFKRATNSGAKNSSDAKRYAKAYVNNVRGLILLPDNWETSTYTLSKYDTKNAAYTTNKISAAQWSILEKAGAIFLPTTRYRDGTKIDPDSSIEDANYWSTTYDAQHPGFDNGDVYINTGCHRHFGHAVRLARDVQY